MMNVKWDLGGFNVYLDSKYSNLYEVEKDINILCGSSNFSELGEEDWFLINKDTRCLEFLLLSIPASINELDECCDVCIADLKEISLDDFIGKNIYSFPMQHNAFFSLEKNQLLVCSSLKSLFYKIRLTDYFYLLMDEKECYGGFLLDNATNHISSESDFFNNKGFNDCLVDMLSLCKQEAYDAMDKQEKQYFEFLMTLEKKCLDIQERDCRVSHILKFVKNAKFTFYDIDGCGLN